MNHERKKKKLNFSECLWWHSYICACSLTHTSNYEDFLHTNFLPFFHHFGFGFLWSQTLTPQLSIIHTSVHYDFNFTAEDLYFFILFISTTCNRYSYTIIFNAAVNNAAMTKIEKNEFLGTFYSMRGTLPVIE